MLDPEIHNKNFLLQISFNVTFLYQRNINKIKLMHSAVELVYSVFLSGVCLSTVCRSGVCRSGVCLLGVYISEVCLSETCLSEICLLGVCSF